MSFLKNAPQKKSGLTNSQLILRPKRSKASPWPRFKDATRCGNPGDVGWWFWRWRLLRIYGQFDVSDQIIGTENTSFGPPKMVAFWKALKSPYCRENLGWWNVIIWPLNLFLGRPCILKKTSSLARRLKDEVDFFTSFFLDLPGKRTNVPWKSMVGRCISYWNGPFLGDMLVFWGCNWF